MFIACAISVKSSKLFVLLKVLKTKLLPKAAALLAHIAKLEVATIFGAIIEPLVYVFEPVITKLLYTANVIGLLIWFNNPANVESVIKLSYNPIYAISAFKYGSI